MYCGICAGVRLGSFVQKRVHSAYRAVWTPDQVRGDTSCRLGSFVQKRVHSAYRAVWTPDQVRGDTSCRLGSFVQNAFTLLIVPSGPRIRSGVTLRVDWVRSAQFALPQCTRRINQRQKRRGKRADSLRMAKRKCPGRRLTLQMYRDSRMYCAAGLQFSKCQFYFAIVHLLRIIRHVW